MEHIEKHTNDIKIEPYGFNGLGIDIKIMQVLDRLGFKTPTPIQHKAIPVAIEGKDIVGIAQTGTGKTLAFGIPMIQRLAKLQGKKGLIILPTRELALQVEETLQKVGRTFGLKTAVIIGGASMGLQIKQLRYKPHIVIGTPGRINDHLQKRTLQLQDVAILVLDEADLMFDMGFAPQIKEILSYVPKDRQTMLFSATMPEAILKIATGNMKLPVRFEIAPHGTTAEKVSHELFFVKADQKMPLLLKLLSDYKGSVLVFTRTKHGAKKICKNLNTQHVGAAEIHSNRSLGQRKEALAGFKSGQYRVLVATDIASRGIDVKGIELVLNYDVPESPSDYVHRIGRTGRAGMEGKAISFAGPDQRHKVKDIERLIKYIIPISVIPGFSSTAPTYDYQKTPQRNNHRRPQRNFKRNFSKRY